MGRTLAFAVLMAAGLAGSARPGAGATLHTGGRGRHLRRRPARRGLGGDTIVWADGSRSSLTSPHPGVIIGNKSSVVVGQGVFTGQGKGVVPMENPSDPTRARCPVLDGLAVLLRGPPPAAPPNCRRGRVREGKPDLPLIARVIWGVQPLAKKYSA